MQDFFFKLQKTKGLAKAGVLSTPHGKIKTPVFMPVGTQASVKALSNQDLKNAGAQVILGNTYHLYLRPGHELISDFGGLHRFMLWDKPILTDSGGYQVSSLGLFNNRQTGSKKLAKITEDGVWFKSHIDGSSHFVSPEKSVDIQACLGADVIMAFDEATPDMGRDYAAEAMQRTHRWLDRCIDRWQRNEEQKAKGSIHLGNMRPQALLGIIQGGRYEDLRNRSAEYVVSKDLLGVAIGGGSIGQDWRETEENVSWVRPVIPKDKPLYLMGVGVNPIDVVEAVKSGADMFDCVAPTRLARMGNLYTGKLTGFGFESEFEKGRLNIANSRFKKDKKPIDNSCDCHVCQMGYSRAYLRHLFKAKELLYYRLASIHNTRFMLRLTQMLRQEILRG